MKPHPDFADLVLPRALDIGTFRLTPLSPDQVDEDLAAVLAAAPLIKGVFGGDWPEGLTRAENLVDMCWHEREFTARRSFAWIVRDARGTYLGCFYLYPAMGARGQCDAVFWLCDIADRPGTARLLRSELALWLSATLPSNIDVSWTTSPKLGETP